MQEPRNVVLVVSNYNRPNQIKQFSGLAKHFELRYILFPFEFQVKRHPEMKILFYHQFESAFSLLEQNNVVGVIFHSLYDHNEYALLWAAKQLGIPTIYTDHGIQDSKIKLQSNHRLHIKKRIYNLFSKASKVLIKQGVKNTINNRRFFRRTLAKLDKEFIKYCQPKVKTLASLSAIREPDFENYFWTDYYIPFSKHNAKEAALYRFIPKDSIYCYTGIPEFDDLLTQIKSEDADERMLLYIDQPYVHYKRHGWTRKIKNRLF